MTIYNMLLLCVDALNRGHHVARRPTGRRRRPVQSPACMRYTYKL